MRYDVVMRNLDRHPSDILAVAIVSLTRRRRPHPSPPKRR